MNSFIFVTLTLVAIASSAPTEKKPTVEIIRYSSERKPDGSYAYSYATSDGSSREETGLVKQTLDDKNNPQNVIVVSGSYSYLNEEGQTDTITYFADETGYHADGKAIPKVV